MNNYFKNDEYLSIYKFIIKKLNIETKIFTDINYANYFLDIYTNYYKNDYYEMEDNLLYLFHNTSTKLHNSNINSFIATINNISNDFTDFIINTILQNKEYIDFNNSNISKNNNRKQFISIDLVSANFQSLKYISNNLVLNTNNYKDFLTKYFELFISQDNYQIDNSLVELSPILLKILAKDKYKRQVLFWNLNPKRQQIISYNNILEITNILLNFNLISKDDIFLINNDELIIDISYLYDNVVFLNEKTNDIIKITNWFRKILSDNTNLQFKIDAFDLHSIIYNGYNDDWFVKKSLIVNDNFELKGVPKNRFLSAIKSTLLNNYWIQNDNKLNYHEYDDYFIDGETWKLAKYI